ncbi:MAG: hypothetical protein OIF58_02830, partial [Cohaesibacter sp.]|nr:hypothetical protein [Cohaesibacter sp.]
QGDKWSKGKGDAKGQGGKGSKGKSKDSKGKGKGKGKPKGFGKKGKLNELEADPTDLWYEDWWYDANWDTWVTASMHDEWTEGTEHQEETSAQADEHGSQSNGLVISMMLQEYDDVETGLFLEGQGSGSDGSEVLGSSRRAPQPFLEGSCSGRGSKKSCKSVLRGCS